MGGGGGGVVVARRERNRQGTTCRKRTGKVQQQKGGKCKKEKGTKASHRVFQFYSDGISLGGSKEPRQGVKGNITDRFALRVTISEAQINRYCRPCLFWCAPVSSTHSWGGCIHSLK